MKSVILKSKYNKYFPTLKFKTKKMAIEYLNKITEPKEWYDIKAEVVR